MNYRTVDAKGLSELNEQLIHNDKLLIVGAEYQTSVLDIAWFTPTQDAWNDGDHTGQCAVYDPGDTQLTGTLRGTRR